MLNNEISHISSKSIYFSRFIIYDEMHYLVKIFRKNKSEFYSVASSITKIQINSVS